MLTSANQFINLVNHTINLENVESITVIIQSRDNLRRRYTEDCPMDQIFSNEFSYLGINDRVKKMVESIITRIPDDCKDDRFDCLVKFNLGKAMNLEITLGNDIKLSSIKRTTNKINKVSYC